MRRCLHCLEPACASACPTTALDRRADGPVIYDANQCIGCRYCIWACPWGVPTAEWDSLTPKIQKCTHCADRTDQPTPLTLNGQPLSQDESELYRDSIATPACVKACPADCLRFGTRDELLQEAHNRISNSPDKYVDHVYGEKEAGGTSVLYLSSVPFDKLGFPDVSDKSYPGFSKTALHAVPPAVIAVGALLAGVYMLLKRRTLALAGVEHARVAVFGECVDLLWAQGNVDGAIQMEKLGNRLAKIYDVDILCGYSLGSVEGGMDSDTFQRICAEHSAVHHW